jgi:hypothetical protein
VELPDVVNEVVERVQHDALIEGLAHDHERQVRLDDEQELPDVVVLVTKAIEPASSGGWLHSAFSFGDHRHRSASFSVVEDLFLLGR